MCVAVVVAVCGSERVCVGVARHGIPLAILRSGCDLAGTLTCAVESGTVVRSQSYYPMR